MKAYYTYFKLRFITGLQYRQAAIASIITQLFFGFTYIFIYLAFYQSDTTHIPMELNKLITYIWFNQIFFSLIYQFYKDKELISLAKTGNISYELLRPKNIYFLWYFKIIGQRLSMLALRFLPMLIVVLLLKKPYSLIAPPSLINFFLFIITLIFGTFLSTALTTLYPIITLKTLSDKGIVNIFIVMADIFSGLVIPIPFFPTFLKNISALLPFQYISDLPFRLYIGNISVKTGFLSIFMQLIWTIILIISGYYLLKKTLKRVEIQGG